MLQPIPYWLLIHFMFVLVHIVPKIVAPNKIIFANPGAVKLQEIPIGIPPPPGTTSLFLLVMTMTLGSFHLRDSQNVDPLIPKLKAGALP